MKKYDFLKAKQFVEKNKDNIQCACLGMEEDWFWTAETIFENGAFTVDLDNPYLEIGGISGSSWATPVLDVEYKDGTSEKYECYTGESDNEMPVFGALMFGELSSKCQEERAKTQIKKITEE